MLAPHLRFQVSIPMVNSVLPPRIFPNRDDLDRIRPGYEAATRAEIAMIVQKIPASDLAIQWDCSTEVQDSYGAIPGFPLEGAIERNLDRSAQSRAAHSARGRAWLSFLLRHAGRLAALSARRSRAGGEARQCLCRRIRPAGGLDSHSGARPQRRRVLRAARGTRSARRTRLSRRHPQHGAVQGAHRDRAQISARRSGSAPIAVSAGNRRRSCAIFSTIT